MPPWQRGEGGKMTESITQTNESFNRRIGEEVAVVQSFTGKEEF